MFRQLALPDAHDTPPALPQEFAYAAIPGFISTNLVAPRFGVSFWGHVLAAIVAVPKASINENRDLHHRPNEVRSPWQRPVPSPTSYARPSQQRNKPLLGCFVFLAANSGHQPATGETAEGGPFPLCVSRPSTHALPCQDAREASVAKTVCPTSFAYSGGTAFPMMLHTASIWLVMNRKFSGKV